MAFTHEFLTSNLWVRVSQAARKASVKRAAIAYVHSDFIKFTEGDLLLVDASESAIRSGGTSAKVLRAAHNRGAEIRHCPYLHAKVLVLDDCAVIGSANLSASSVRDLEECAILTRDRRLVGQAQAFLQQLSERSKLLTDHELARLEKIPVIRRNTRPKRHSRKSTSQKGRWWIIGLKPIKRKLTRLDDAARERAEAKALKVRPSSRGRLDWFKMSGKSAMRNDARRGDSVISLWGTQLPICPPVTILSRAKGDKSTFFYYDKAEEEKLVHMSKTAFSRLLSECGVVLELKYKMVRELKPEVAEFLDRHWPRA